MVHTFESKVNEAFDELVREGEALLSQAMNARGGFKGEVATRLSAWVASSEQLLCSLFPSGGPYWRNFKATLDRENERVRNGGFFLVHSEHHGHLSEVVGFLRAARDDFRKGRARRIRELVRAEVFSDFLEMGEHLLEQGYKDPAAVIIGGVLENAVRKRAENAGIRLTFDDGAPKKAERLNQDLGSAEAYTMLTQKRVTSWLELRNKAAHAEYNQYSDAAVKEMLMFVRGFVNEG